jgi:transposase
LAAGATHGLQRKRQRLTEALTGWVGEHQLFLLRQILAHIEFIEQQIAALNGEVVARTRPFEAAIAALDQIPGISRRAAEEVLAEIGTDMSGFPSHRHLASWAKVCPGNNQSGAKRRSGYSGKGNRWLKSALVDSAWCSARTRNSYFSALYHRLAARRGKKRAQLAVAHSLLVTIYHLRRSDSTYQDLGATYFDDGDRNLIERRAVRNLERLGYRVALERAA